MSRSRTRYFDQTSEPLERRIATGLHKVGLAMKQENWRKAAEDGLSPTQGQILAALALEAPLTGTELAARLGLKLPTISESVRVLVEKALVDRDPDPRHPRATRLSLTPAGRDQAARASAWPEFLASAVSTLSGPEQEAFLAGLVKMIRALQESGRILVTRMCVSCVYFRPDVHDGPRPHHCAFVDAPMATGHLRIDCPEHEEAPVAEKARIRARFQAR